MPTAVNDGNFKNKADPVSGLYWKITAFDNGQRIAEEQFGNSVFSDYAYFVPGSSAPECQQGNGAFSCMPGSLQSEATFHAYATWPYRQRDYSYDRERNLGIRKDRPSSSETLTQTYQYDAFGRLLEQDFTNSSKQRTNYTTWSYSPSGDINTRTDYDEMGASAVQEYGYDAVKRHQLTSIGTRVFAYDDNGNQISRQSAQILGGTQPQSIQYNDFNMPRLVTGNTGGNTDTTLDYDAMHQRVAKRGKDKTTVYAGDFYECEGKTPAAGETFACDKQRFKVYGGGKLVAVVTRDTFDNDDLKFVHGDRLGSSSLITDKDGSVVEARDFEAFGGPIGNVGFTSTGINSGFTGQEHDAELGLINMGGRLYDPSVGRFITADPFVSRPFDPQGLNRFSYVRNNPLNAVDPSGFSECSGSDCAGGMGGWGSSSYSGGASDMSGSPSSSASPTSSSVPATQSASVTTDYGGAQISNAQQQQFNQNVAIAGQKAQASMSTAPVCFSGNQLGSPQGGAGAGGAYAGPGGSPGTPPGYGEGYGMRGGSYGALSSQSASATESSHGGGTAWSPGAQGGSSVNAVTPASHGNVAGAGGNTDTFGGQQTYNGNSATGKPMHLFGTNWALTQAGMFAANMGVGMVLSGVAQVVVRMGTKTEAVIGSMSGVSQALASSHKGAMSMDVPWAKFDNMILSDQIQAVSGWIRSVAGLGIPVFVVPGEHGIFTDVEISILETLGYVRQGNYLILP